MPSDPTPEQWSDALETIRSGIMDRLDFDTGPTQWAKGALDALLAAGWTPPAQPDAIAAAEARGRREGIEAAAIPKLLTNAQVNNACMSYRHDYGLCTESEARFMRSQCNEWFRAIRTALSPSAAQEARDAE